MINQPQNKRSEKFTYQLHFLLKVVVSIIRDTFGQPFYHFIIQYYVSNL